MRRLGHFQPGFPSAVSRNMAFGQSAGGLPILGPPGHLALGGPGLMVETWWRYLLRYGGIAFDRTSMVGANGAPCASVLDLFTGAEIATAAGAARPTLTATGCSLDGINQYLSSTYTSASTSYSLLFVCDETHTIGASTSALLSWTGGGTPFVGYTERSGYVASYYGAVVNGEAAKNGLHLYEFAITRSGGDNVYDFYRDGVLLATGTVATASSALVGSLNIGRYFGGGQLFKGEILFGAIVPSILSAEDRAVRNAVVMAHYGLAFDWRTSIANVRDWNASIGVLNSGGLPCSDGENIATWQDQGASAWHATQAVDADRTAYLATAGVNGGPGVEFDLANTEFLRLGAVTTATSSMTLFAVLNQATLATEQCLFGTTPGDLMFTARHVGNIGFYDNSVGWTNLFAAITGDQLLTWHRNASVESGARNGVTLGSAACGNVQFLGTATSIGARADGTEHFDGVLSRAVFITPACTTQERAIINAALIAEYEL